MLAIFFKLCAHWKHVISEQLHIYEIQQSLKQRAGLDLGAILALPLTGCMTLSRSLNLSELPLVYPQIFSHRVDHHTHNRINVYLSNLYLEIHKDGNYIQYIYGFTIIQPLLNK